MARKAKRSSCQIEHWWEEKGYFKRGAWGLCTDQDKRSILRHIIECRHLGRDTRPDDLKKIRANTLGRLGIGHILQKSFKNSPHTLLSFVYPEFFDWSRSDHLHEWDLSQQGMWHSRRKDDLVRTATRHTIEEHRLRRPVKPQDLLEISRNTLIQLGLGGVLRVFNGSPYALLRHTYPEFFDWSTTDHLHEWDFKQQGYLKRKDWRTRTHLAIRHTVEEHHLGRPAKAGDLPKLKAKILKHLGFGGLLARRFSSSPVVLLRHAYPEFFDLSRPDHVHSWDIRHVGMRQGAKGRALARSVVHHMLEDHHLGRRARVEDLKGVGALTFLRLGLKETIGQLDGLSAALRYVYPEFFDWSRPDHLHEWNFPRQRMWRDQGSDELARTAIRHMIEVHHLGRTAKPADLVIFNRGSFQKLGLESMLSKKYRGSTSAALRHAYPEFAEAIGRRIKGTADFVEVLENEDPKQARQLVRDLMRHFGDDLVDVADILAVVYTGRLEAKTAMEILQDPSMRPWIVPFDGRGHGPGKPPIGDDFPFYLLEKDKNGVITGIIRRRLTEWRRKVLGARPSKEVRTTFLRQLRALQDKFRTNGGKEMAPAAE